MNRTFATLFLALACAATSTAGLSAQSAREIIEDVQKRSATSSLQHDAVLQSFDSEGKTSEKRWTFRRVGSHGRSKLIIRFNEPAEVRGVALLVFNHPDKASDQWMWTPALERDRRIALQDRSTRFFGTDFSFEDLEERDVDQYSYKLMPDRKVAGFDGWTIESTPVEAKASQYSKSLLWVRKDIVAVVRIDSFVKDQATRRLRYLDFQNIQGIWTARELNMMDIRKGSNTRLLLSKIQYDAPLNDSDFTLQALRRPR